MDSFYQGWLLGVDQDYKVALVGGPSHKYFFLVTLNLMKRYTSLICKTVWLWCF